MNAEEKSGAIKLISFFSVEFGVVATQHSTATERELCCLLGFESISLACIIPHVFFIFGNDDDDDGGNDDKRFSKSVHNVPKKCSPARHTCTHKHRHKTTERKGYVSTELQE